MNLDARIEQFDELFPQRNLERWFRAIAEEAGEVLGAFNKWRDGNKLKPRNQDDVLEEMSQLMGCVFVAAAQLGLPPEGLLEAMDEFLDEKYRQIKKIREEESER